jgi:hypothetical protein
VPRPIDNSYQVSETGLHAGEYPGVPPGAPAEALEGRLAQFLDAGITAFIDLTDPADPLEPYEPALRTLAARRGVEVHYARHTIRDMDVCDDAHMRGVLGAIDDHLAAGRNVYVHCWGGVGRTGIAVGCWLVERGRSGDEALSEVLRLFHTMSPEKVRDHGSWGSPQTNAQRAMVRRWARRAPASGSSNGAEAGAGD